MFLFWLLSLFFFTSNANAQTNKKLNYNVFCFYYNWYGNPDHDGKYIHWAHPVLKSGPSDTTTRYIPGANHNIAANFYPALGTYSSDDRAVISAHMKMIAGAGIGNIVLTWWAKDSFTTQSVSLIMDEAAKRNIKVSFHIEPFSGRNAATTRQTIQYIMDTYGNHPAFYRSERHGNKPFFFVYDSYLTTAKDWSALLMPGGELTIRNTRFDAVMIGLWVSPDLMDLTLILPALGLHTVLLL